MESPKSNGVSYSRTFAAVIVGVGISVIFSSAALYISWNDRHHELISKRDHPVEHNIRIRAINQPTAAPTEDCSGAALSNYDTSSEDGALKQRVHRLSCEFSSLQQQLDTWIDEFNTMLFFINEIGVNMQAAKNQIEANKRRVRSAQAISEQALNVSIDNSRIIGEVGPSVEGLYHLWNATVQTNADFFTTIMTRTSQNERLLQMLNSSMTAGAGRLAQASDHDSGRLQQIVRTINFGEDEPVGNTSTWLGELQAKNNKNSKAIESVRHTVETVKDQLNNFDAGDWFNAPNGYQYFLSRSAFTSNAFTRSRRYCKYKGGELAYVGMRKAQHFRFLWNNLLGPSRHHCVWIGMTDMEREGRWLWLDGEPVTDHWVNWAAGQPGLRAHSEDCGMVRAGFWDDGPCSGFRKVCSFLCERKILSL